MAMSSPGSGLLKVVVFGDSLTKYLAEDIAILDQSVKADVFCQRGATIDTLSDAILHDWCILTQLTPDVVFVHVGTNTLEHQLVAKTVFKLQRLCILVQNLYPGAQVAVNNILNRYDDNNLNDAGKWLNVQIRSLCNVSPAFAGENFSRSKYAGDNLHLNEQGYLRFAIEVVSECHRISQSTTSGTFPPSMIPPVNHQKTPKQKLRDRRKHLRESAERCRFTRPCLATKTAKVRAPVLPTRSYEEMHGPVVPVITPVHAGLYCAKVKSGRVQSSLQVPSSPSPYVAKKQAVKRRRKQTRKAKRRRRRKMKRKYNAATYSVINAADNQQPTPKTSTPPMPVVPTPPMPAEPTPPMPAVPTPPMPAVPTPPMPAVPTPPMPALPTPPMPVVPTPPMPALPTPPMPAVPTPPMPAVPTPPMPAEPTPPMPALPTPPMPVVPTPPMPALPTSPMPALPTPPMPAVSNPPMPAVPTPPIPIGDNTPTTQATEELIGYDVSLQIVCMICAYIVDLCAAVQLLQG
ncbi:uncharacterized protein [Amphiura filiformis]|uniref:uncharacterized protein n=1 Tax=Amphiura filiformis TaxID=82378 RepID=UPI003B211D7D